MAGTGGIIAPGMERVRPAQSLHLGAKLRKEVLSMAAPQSFVPKRPSRSKSVRRFTLKEANSTLPLVKRIVADIVKAHIHVADLRQRVQTLEGGKELAEAQHQLDAGVEQLKDFVSELASVGAELKDFETGLIDFIGRHDGRDVYLCWKLGEEEITHWHELDAGFTGRKPIAALHEE
jgi:hypothetical protein